MQKFEYMLLSRLQADCEYYLNMGNRSPRVLWANSEKDQISKMKEIWHILEIKPEWLTFEQIKNYEKNMLASC